jgi:hypothetical protein
VRQVELSRDASILAVRIDPAPKDVPHHGEVVIWDLGTSQKKTTIATGVTTDMVLASDGAWLAIADEHNVKIWDPLSGDELSVLSGETSILDLSLSPDGLRLAAAGVAAKGRDHGVVLVWSTSGWPDDAPAEATVLHDEDTPQQLIFAPDSKILAVAAAQRLRGRAAVRPLEINFGIWRSGRRADDWVGSRGRSPQWIFLPTDECSPPHRSCLGRGVK